MACLKVHIGVDQYSTIPVVQTLLTEQGLSYEISWTGPRPKLSSAATSASVVDLSVDPPSDSDHQDHKHVSAPCGKPAGRRPSVVATPVSGIVRKAKALVHDCASCVKSSAKLANTAMDLDDSSP